MSEPEVFQSRFLALPAELRLHIVSYVFAQTPSIPLDATYSSSAQLAVRLVCRQFNSDFTNLALRGTNFVIKNPQHLLWMAVFRPLREQHLKNLRKVACIVTQDRLEEMANWREFPFDTELLHLEELGILCQSRQLHNFSQVTMGFVQLLRRLRNVQRVKVVENDSTIIVDGSFRAWFNRIVGLILKEDHYQRYIADGAPRVETTWWEWSYERDEKSFTFVSQSPREVMEEGAYMEYVKPMVEKLVMEMARE